MFIPFVPEFSGNQHSNTEVRFAPQNLLENSSWDIAFLLQNRLLENKQQIKTKY